MYFITGKCRNNIILFILFNVKKYIISIFCLNFNDDVSRETKQIL